MTSEVTGPRVMALIGDHEPNGVLLWRVVAPVLALQRVGYPAFMAKRGDREMNAYLPSMDLVSIQRLSWDPDDEHRAYLWRSKLHQAQVALCYETDDDIFSPQIVDWLARTERGENKSDAQLEADRQARIFALSIADGVTVPTEALATIVRQYTDGLVTVAPNLIDLASWHAVQRTSRRAFPAPVIGWAGGNRPAREVEAMAIAWGRLARRYPQLRFQVVGYQLAPFGQHVPEEQLIRVPLLPVEHYPLGYLGIDIGCCPLTRDEPFNAGKSPIKALEYAASGSAVVASPLVYSEVIEHGETGFLAETADEWEWALAQLVEQTKLRRRLARRLFARVKREHSLERQLWRWPDAWQQIVEATFGSTRIEVGA